MKCPFCVLGFLSSNSDIGDTPYLVQIGEFYIFQYITQHHEQVLNADRDKTRHGWSASNRPQSVYSVSLHATDSQCAMLPFETFHNVSCRPSQLTGHRAEGNTRSLVKVLCFILRY